MNGKEVFITILVNNTAGSGLIDEHGLSLYIEAEGRHILFDTGQGQALSPNAEAMNKDLSRVDTLILSHGHYDHSGAVDQVLNLAPLVDFYAHPGVVQPRYKLDNGTPIPLQMPHSSMAALNKLSENQLHWIAEPVQLTQKIWLTGPIPRETDFEDTGGAFYLDSKGCRKDPIFDDLALWVETSQGLVICVGCAHAGLVNTINYIQTLTDEVNIRAILGGFHLHNAGNYRLNQTVENLILKKVDRIIPCHCTGDYAIAKLRTHPGLNVTSTMAGMTYMFD